MQGNPSSPVEHYLVIRPIRFQERVSIVALVANQGARFKIRGRAINSYNLKVHLIVKPITTAEVQLTVC